MLSTFYVLRALADEWHALIPGSAVADVYSQHPGELSIEVTGTTNATLRARLTGPLRFVIADPQSARARRNVATVLEPLRGQKVTGVRVADRDRILYLDFSDARLALTIFGGKANAVLLDQSGNVVDRFRSVGDDMAPRARSAPDPSVWMERARTLLHESAGVSQSAAKLARALNPLMNKLLSAECVFRFGNEQVATDDELERLVGVVASVDAESMAARHPAVYWDGDRPVALSLLTLQHLGERSPHLNREVFDTVSEASRVFAKRALAWSRYDQQVGPIKTTATRDRDKQLARVEAISAELARPSRADEYERLGHILMAAPMTQIPDGERRDLVSITLPDPFDENKPTTVAVAPGLSAVENAQRYYEKARSARLSREHAEERVLAMVRELDELQQTVDVLEAVSGPDSLRALKKESPDLVSRVLSSRADAKPEIPYRRYDLGSGYEVWVGRNAKQNDELTTRAARKFDLWLHARGVPGSHVVLRRPNRSATIPDHYVERAAQIAAYHSKARGSGLVPVIVAEKKYVRKPRGAAPGTVLVDRQRVVIVEPGVPAETT